MNFTTAEHYARQIAAWVQPHCHLLEIAGSVRRHRPQCADIDLVVVAKTEVVRDMFGEVVSYQNKLHQFLLSYTAATPASKWLAGEKGGPNASNLLLQLPKCQLDIFLATEETFPYVLLCRSGSKEHNIWLAQRAQRLGGKWHPLRGLELNGAFVPADSEAEIYGALNLPFIEPENRELAFLRQFDRAQTL